MEENVQIWETEAGGLGVQGIFSHIAYISNSKPDRAIRSGKKREKEKIQIAKTIQRKPCFKKKKAQAQQNSLGLRLFGEQLEGQKSSLRQASSV